MFGKNKAEIRSDLQADARLAAAFLTDEAWAAARPVAVLVDGPVMLRCITNEHQASGGDAAAVITETLRWALGRPGRHVCAFVVDKPTVSVTKGVIQGERIAAANAVTGVYKRAKLDQEISELRAAIAALRERPTELVLVEGDVPPGYEELCLVDRRAVMLRHEHALRLHEERVAEKERARADTRGQYTLLDTVRPDAHLRERYPTLRALLAASAGWPLPAPWSEVVGEYRPAIMQWLTRMLLYSEEHRFVPDVGKCLILDGHYMWAELFEDAATGGYAANPVPDADTGWQPLLVENATVAVEAAAAAGELAYADLQMAALEREPDVRLERPPEFANRVGEAENAFFFHMLAIARRWPALPLAFEIVSVDTDALTNALMFLALCRAGRFGERWREPLPQLWHNYGRSTRPAAAIDVTMLYHLLVREYLAGDYDAVPSLVAAIVAAGGDYVIGYYFVKAKFMVDSIALDAGYVEQVDRYTRERRRRLVELTPDGRLCFSGHAYRALVECAYLRKHAVVARRLPPPNCVPTNAIRAAVNAHVVPEKPVNFKAYEASVHTWPADEELFNRMMAAFKKRFPPDEELASRGLRVWGHMLVMAQLGEPVVTEPDPLAYGFALKDPALPLSRKNIKMLPALDYEDRARIRKKELRKRTLSQAEETDGTRGL